MPVTARYLHANVVERADVRSLPEKVGVYDGCYLGKMG